MGRHRKHHRNAVLAADVDVAKIATLDPTAPTPMYVMKPRITHTDLEENFNSYIKQTPEYDIRNVGMNPLYLIPALFIPNSRNTLLDRCRRIFAEKFYIVYSDWLDKTSIVISIMCVAAGVATVVHAYSVGAHNVYEFNDPRDVNDPHKKSQLDYLNSVGSAWDVIKLVLAGAPSIIQGWRAFKRSSVPAQGHEVIRVSKLKALTEQNRKNWKKNKLALMDIKRYFSRRETSDDQVTALDTTDASGTMGTFNRGELRTDEITIGELPFGQLAQSASSSGVPLNAMQLEEWRDEATQLRTKEQRFKRQIEETLDLPHSSRHGDRRTSI